MQSDAYRSRRLHIVTTKYNQTTWITLLGEADLSTRADLLSTLTKLDLDKTQEVHLDLGALEFCDARAMSQLLSFIDHLEKQGRAVVVHHPTRTVLRVAELIDGTASLRAHTVSTEVRNSHKRGTIAERGFRSSGYSGGSDLA